MKAGSGSFAIAMYCMFPVVIFSCSREPVPIDRESLVQRHMVYVNDTDSLSALSVGNGRFAFTVDFTGLQTFPGIYENGIPLGTQSEWGWHSFPNKKDYRIEETMKEYNVHGRKVLYDLQWDKPGRQQDAANYLRQNPHRLHLGIIGLDLIHADGSPVKAGEIQMISQVLNPWNGQIHSTFSIDKVPVEVFTCVHQKMDMVAVKIISTLVNEGLLRIRIRFPYPSGQNTDNGCRWDVPDKHASVLRYISDTTATIYRQIDSASYSVKLSWKHAAMVTENVSHDFLIKPAKEHDQFSFSCYFSIYDMTETLPDYTATELNNLESWKRFWQSGGAVDFSGSTNKRAHELERRIILSQYLTKIQCSGKYPPQETGLTYNSWYGKFHMEMYLWHSAHYALWDRTYLLEKSLGYYGEIAENAWKIASRQGFRGYRWPKMTDPLGNYSPSSIGSFLIWQQPHIIYLAELCYRNKPDVETVRKYAGLVFATADFMASYAWRDREENRYILGPALIPAQERYEPSSTINPPFELAYWYYSLKTAQKWRERLDLERNAAWDSVLMLLSPLAKKDGMYLGAESAPDSYTNPRLIADHPMVLGAFGLLPESPLLEKADMKSTFNYIWDHWNWEETWGWDFPMVAMSATRLGMPDKAVDALFMDVAANTWLPNGHNYQDERLRLYLPGNGGLLTAIAMMCAGYSGCKEKNPGFPKDGTWVVKWEGLKKLP